MHEGITGNRAELKQTSKVGETGETGWSIGDGRLWRNNETDSWSYTPAIFLIAIKGTTGGTTATLSDLALSDGVAAITLDQTFASDEYEYQASVANSVSRITVTPTKSDSNATLDYLDGDDNVLPDADTVTEGQQVDLTSGENTIKMKVTAAADTATLTYTVKVTQKARITEVPVDWSLIPAGLTVRDKFRLLFLSSTTRDATSTDIADYNTFVQGIAAAGHADIQAYSSGFRVVGCTGAVDARDNTYTRHTSTDQGVPIYWLGGTRVADEYEDFYDGSWDDEANDRNESGTDGPDTSQDENRPFTGCDHNGTEYFINTVSEALGTNDVHVGRPNSSASGAGPIKGGGAGSFLHQHPPHVRPLGGLPIGRRAIGDRRLRAVNLHRGRGERRQHRRDAERRPGAKGDDPDHQDQPGNRHRR